MFVVDRFQDVVSQRPICRVTITFRRFTDNPQCFIWRRGARGAGPVVACGARGFQSGGGDPEADRRLRRTMGLAGEVLARDPLRGIGFRMYIPPPKDHFPGGEGLGGSRKQGGCQSRNFHEPSARNPLQHTGCRRGHTLKQKKLIIEEEENTPQTKWKRVGEHLEGGLCPAVAGGTEGPTGRPQTGEGGTCGPLGARR